MPEMRVSVVTSKSTSYAEIQMSLFFFWLTVKDENEDADDIVFKMICKSFVSRLNVVFLI